MNGDGGERLLGTGAHLEPSVCLTSSASEAPLPSCSPAVGTSTAKLNSLTAEPVFGGTNEATAAPETITGRGLLSTGITEHECLST